MNRPDLYRAMADAIERNPDGEWWREFEYLSPAGISDFDDETHIFRALDVGYTVRLKPRTYTLHVEDMPEPMKKPPGNEQAYWFVDSSRMEVEGACWIGTSLDQRRFRCGNCFDMEDKAEIVLQRLTAAMGVKDE